MMSKMCAAFIMSISVALTFACNQAFGQSRVGHGGSTASTHSTFHPLATQSLHHLNRRNIRPFFQAEGGFCCGPLNGLPGVDLAPAMTGDFHYTFKNDVPWDWAHRLPPNFFGAAPAESPAPDVSYAPGCRTQIVTAPGADGKDRTIDMVRC
jgi:hypothetical protein